MAQNAQTHRKPRAYEGGAWAIETTIPRWAPATDDLAGWRAFERMAQEAHIAALRLAAEPNRWAAMTAAWLEADLVRIRAQVARLEAQDAGAIASDTVSFANSRPRRGNRRAAA